MMWLKVLIEIQAKAEFSIERVQRMWTNCSTGFDCIMLWIDERFQTRASFLGEPWTA